MKLRKILKTGLVSFLIVIMSSSAFASSNVNIYSIKVDGIDYQVTESIDKTGETQITVTSASETSIVTKNGELLKVSNLDLKSNKTTSQVIDLSTNQSNISSLDDKPVNKMSDTLMSTSASTSMYNKSVFWNYSYYVGTQSPTYGIYWSLTSGDNGSVSRYDGNISSARNYAEGFMGDVNSIQYNQTAAVGAIGFAAASAIAGALGSGGTLGASAVIGIVLAVGGSLVSVAYWTAAYSSSILANYKYSRFEALTK